MYIRSYVAQSVWIWILRVNLHSTANRVHKTRGIIHAIAHVARHIAAAIHDRIHASVKTSINASVKTGIHASVKTGIHAGVKTGIQTGILRAILLNTTIVNRIHRSMFVRRRISSVSKNAAKDI
jgi:hypothetical protein